MSGTTQRKPLTALEWLRVTHADTLSGRRIEEAVAAARAEERQRWTTADVTREPTGGQGLREAVAQAMFEVLFNNAGGDYPEAADAVLALPELAAVIADAERWRNRGRNLPREFRVELEDCDGEPQP